MEKDEEKKVRQNLVNEWDKNWNKMEKNKGKLRGTKIYKQRKKSENQERENDKSVNLKFYEIR